MRTAIITGGTSGIGAAAVKIFLAHDFNCVVVGRSRARFEKIRSELGGRAARRHGGQQREQLR